MAKKKPYIYYIALTLVVILLLILIAPKLQQLTGLGQGTSSDNSLQFNEINDMEDAESVLFNWYEDPNAWTGGFSLYFDDANMKSLVVDLTEMKVTEGNLDEHDIGVGQPNSYLIAFVHDSSKNIYTTLTVNDKGSVQIWNRYANGETPEFYISENNQAFYEKVVGIVAAKKDREKSATKNDEVPFEYKAETAVGTSILEIRSQDGKLIADVSDIEPNSLQVVTRVTGNTALQIRFIDKEFVYRFTKAHIGETTYFYLDGDVIFSPFIAQPLLTNDLVIEGDFTEVSLEEILAKMNQQ
ncbi:hypothetical protein AWH56_022980 [Anaerobacillus isosaccharinicus]|uniref:Uncharacterized protein n=1 Tax=Anaerobacillus isosaccharinicus TaxID=1532552 RepID=A0A1S2LN43_9BACI|nr:hypothetical protein [Anaerobacillus isosaccharinicus]MBA5586232.1 hypothetical protein [Anaerobacillus isosaccharinicus]QOY35512.1 hypothetical protein AWH56_022980 [Anaerobacillus isosaccharinicus]